MKPTDVYAARMSRLRPLASFAFAVPMSGRHVRRAFDERCR
jgi:hypothetical protein